MNRIIATAFFAVMTASCATSNTANTRYDKPQACARDEVVACDSGSRIQNAPRFCTCRPAWQTLNTDI